MRVFVVRLNPDPRNCLSYSQYASEEEYRSIHKSSPMDGFHEAVNFLPEKGVVRGYLPPRHLVAMKSGETFTLITITAKTAKSGGDKIIGIQSGCVYMGETERRGVSHKQSLTWHYCCPASQSCLFPESIPSARSAILGRKDKWVRGPTFKLNRHAYERVYRTILTNSQNYSFRRKFKSLTKPVNESSLPAELEVESKFEREVAKAFRSNLESVKGNDCPTQREVRTFQFVRDPKVVAVVLKSANGVCFDCKKKGPFISKITGLPFLEVHHVNMLKNYGQDTPENAVALCPNCHRKRHHG